MPGLMTVIIADDLTGALDSVAPFAALGLVCLVATSPESLPRTLALRPQVVAINLGTREGDAASARVIARLAALLAKPNTGSQTVWFKKIDSRMKGHIAAEVAGLCSAIPASQLLVCPAIPELGRVVTAGHLDGEGVATPIPVALHLPDGISAEWPDALNDADLDRMVQRSATGMVFVGAKGLAAAVARRQRPDHPTAAVPMPTGPVGFCVGSRDPISLAQVDLLRSQAAVPYVAAPDGLVPPGDPSGDVLLQATQGPGASAPQVATHLANAMLRRAGGLKTVVIVGGETSAALLSAAGIGVLRVSGEVLAGLPLCHAVEIPDFPAIVTKSGGFGQPDTLLRLWQAGHSKERPPWP